VGGLGIGDTEEERTMSDEMAGRTCWGLRGHWDEGFLAICCNTSG